MSAFLSISVTKESVTTIEQHIQKSERTESKQARTWGYLEEKAFTRHPCESDRSRKRDRDRELLDREYERVVKRVWSRHVSFWVSL